MSGLAQSWHLSAAQLGHCLTLSAARFAQPIQYVQNGQPPNTSTKRHSLINFRLNFPATAFEDFPQPSHIAPAANSNKMRLLDVHSVTTNRLPVFYKIVENGSSSPPPYAILSHTWGKSEDYEDIVFDDIPSSETFARFLDEETQLKRWRGAVSKKNAGFSKIANACRIARGMELDYIWIDSCCIDKSKSAELNQSINSMFRWYKNSDRCIVYLEDLEPDGELEQCRWFKRGWTLQEFVAPSEVTFYDKHWDLYGERSDMRLHVSLSSITGIDMDCLQDEAKLASLSIAHKMSWAAGRDTTIPEDRAYSLLGIFDINMALIYGEGGTKAFRRLQEEITKVSSDVSIFAWDPSHPSSPGKADLDAFASSPDDFIKYNDMVPSYQTQHFTGTNKGIEMTTTLWRVICEDKKERLMLAIGKQKNGKPDIGIILHKLSHNVYIRHGNMRPFLDKQITSSTSSSTFYLVSPHLNTAYDHVLNASRSLAVSVPLDGLGNFRTERIAPEYAWDCEDRLFFNNRYCRGSDWRAVELINNGPVPECDHCFVVLINLKDETPDCYLLRWREELSFMFDRRHKTEATSLNEFRHVVQGKTNEIDIKSTGAKLSIQLILTTTKEHSGEQFRMEVREESQTMPDSAASARPTTANSHLLELHDTRQSTCIQVQGSAVNVAQSDIHSLSGPWIMRP